MEHGESRDEAPNDPEGKKFILLYRGEYRLLVLIQVDVMQVQTKDWERARARRGEYRAKRDGTGLHNDRDTTHPTPHHTTPADRNA